MDNQFIEATGSMILVLVYGFDGNPFYLKSEPSRALVLSRVIHNSWLLSFEHGGDASGIVRYILQYISIKSVHFSVHFN